MADPTPLPSASPALVPRVAHPVSDGVPTRAPLRHAHRPRHRWRWVLGALVAIGVTGLAVALLRRGAQPVELATVARGIVTQTIMADGTTRIVRRHAVGAPVAGVLQRIALQAGDTVRRGDVLARLTPVASALYDARSASQATERVGALRAALAQARTAAARADLARVQSARDLERTRRLDAAGAIPRQLLEQAELADAQRDADARAARAAVDMAEHELSAARAVASGGEGGSVAARVVPAPMRGVVLRVIQTDEGVVTAGTPLLELGDLSSLEVVTDVLSDDALRVQTGAPARIVAGQDTARATVQRVEPMAFTKRSSLGVDEQRVRVVLAPAAGGHPVPFGDGFRVDVELELARSRDSVATVPAGALIREGSGWSVYAVRDGVARLIPVRIGLRSATTAEILAGISPGEQVILFPSDQVRDGVRIVPRAVGAPSVR